jgi:cyclophilin family peptidyl-prolyl cis-trans isomerase
MKVYIQNVGQVKKVEAPQNPEAFSVRLKAEDIDLSSVESLDLFEATGDITDYVLLDMKIAGTVKLSDTETVENYEGKILVRLFPDVAPLTVSNFKSLVGSSFYNGLTIHRVIPDFVIQGGDPQGNGTGGSDNDIFGEFTSNGFTNNLAHKRGVLSMARSDDPDSASSQFFICHKDAASLDSKYATFGYVVYGMDVVDVIAGLETDADDKPKVKVTIEKASFVKKKA